MAAIAAAGAPAVMFGGEQAGLDNDAVALADAIVTYPVAAEFWSLNLAQAVAVFAYEWAAGAGMGLPEKFRDEAPEGQQGPATREELAGLVAHFEDELDASGFFWPPIKEDQMKRNFRSMLSRLALTSQEVSTLRGAIKSIAQGPRRRVRELRAREADAERTGKASEASG
jgi:tRNA/rRNA methyltransferase